MALAAKQKSREKGGTSSSTSIACVGAKTDVTGRCSSDELKSPSLALAAAAAMAAIHSLRDLESIPPAILCMGDEIKRGRFKRVYRGKFKRRNVVILQYLKEGDSNELLIIGTLAKRGSSRYIPEICGVCYDDASTSVVQELATWGALKRAMQNAEASARMAPDHKVHIIFQVSRAMAFLHMLRIVHADLSCRNVLLFRLEEDARLCVAKVTDFGLAFELPDEADFDCRKQPQATRWCSPETVAETKFSFRSDVWSFGATCWELFSGGSSLPWKRLDKRADVASRLKTLAELAKKVDDSVATEAASIISQEFMVVGGCPVEVHDAILSCLQAAEQSRPTFLQLLEQLKAITGDEERIPTTLEEMLIDPKEHDEISKGETSGRLCSPSSTTPRGLMSTPSTVDTLEGFDSQRASLHLEGITTDPTIGRSSSNFQLLRQFLESPQASQAAGEDAVREMRNEIDEAEGRQHHRSASTSNLLSSGSQRGPGRSCSMEYLVPLVAASGPLVSDGRQQLPPTNGSWTLTSFLRPAILRQDFECEEDARAAFEAAAEGGTLDGPCVLRNPEGVETESHCWVAAESSQLDARRRKPSLTERRSPSGERSVGVPNRQSCSVRTRSVGAPTTARRRLVPEAPTSKSLKSLSSSAGAPPPSRRPASNVVTAGSLTGRCTAMLPGFSPPMRTAPSSTHTTTNVKGQSSSVTCPPAQVTTTVVELPVTPPTSARQHGLAGDLSNQIAPSAPDGSLTIGSDSGFNQTWPKTQLASALMSLAHTPKPMGSTKAPRTATSKVSGYSVTAPAAQQRGRRCTRSSMPAAIAAQVQVPRFSLQPPPPISQSNQRVEVQATHGPKRSARGVPQHVGSSLRTSSQ